MQIRKTTKNDIDRIMEIYGIARHFMAEHGNPNQWGPTNWPPKELILSDIDAGKSYVCLNDKGRIVGTFFYDFGDDIEPCYREIEEGCWVDESEYGVIHRIASDGTERGVGSYCIQWVFSKCGHLKIDTHGDNVVMQGLLTKMGFEKRGIIHVEEDNYPRLAYELGDGEQARMCRLGLPANAVPFASDNFFKSTWESIKGLKNKNTSI